MPVIITPTSTHFTERETDVQHDSMISPQTENQAAQPQALQPPSPGASPPETFIEHFSSARSLNESKICKT